jgi:hypothetical protein
MHLWSLQPIYDRAKHFVEHGSTPIERGQARLIIERIEEFAELARRGGYSAMNQTISLASSTASTIGQSQVISAASNGINNPLSANPIYDATGWLVPVYAASPGQPAHALTDASGKITAYITALPGMNLDRYHNQAVGITGLRGYLPQLQAGHVEAQRIVRLER